MHDADRTSGDDAPAATVGVLLAGGLARRMGGGDKGLKRVGGRLILERVIERLRPQVETLILNANGDPERFARWGLTVVPDSIPDFAGPLAGVLAALDWVADARPGIRWVVSVATDSPFIPADLVTRLHSARIGTGAPAEAPQLAVARSGDQTQPVIGLWDVGLREPLRRALVEEGLRKIDVWTARHPLGIADFETDPIDPFFNANTPDDLAVAEALLAQYPAA